MKSKSVDSSLCSRRVLLVCISFVFCKVKDQTKKTMAGWRGEGKGQREQVFLSVIFLSPLPLLFLLRRGSTSRSCIPYFTKHKLNEKHPKKRMDFRPTDRRYKWSWRSSALLVIPRSKKRLLKRLFCLESNRKKISRITGTWLPVFQHSITTCWFLR